MIRSFKLLLTGLSSWSNTHISQLIGWSFSDFSKKSSTKIHLDLCFFYFFIWSCWRTSDFSVNPSSHLWNQPPSSILSASLHLHTIYRWTCQPKTKADSSFLSFFIWNPKSSLCRPRPFAPWELTLCFSRLIYSMSPASSSLLLFRPPPRLSLLSSADPSLTFTQLALFN